MTPRPVSAGPPQAQAALPSTAQARRATQMFWSLIGSPGPSGRFDVKNSVCASLESAGWKSTKGELIGGPTGRGGAGA